MKSYFKNSALLLSAFIFCISTALAKGESEIIFDWAESKYAESFNPRSTTQSIDGWQYRYYSNKNNYIGINEDGQVAVLGEQFGEGVIYVGTVQEYLDTIVNEKLIIEPATKSEALKIISREYYGPVLEFNRLAKAASVFICHEGQWYYCELIGGSWYCWPLGIPC